MSDPQIIDCTKEKPWNKAKDPDVRVRHYDAREVGDHSDEGYARMICPNCGHTWKEELAE